MALRTPRAVKWSCSIRTVSLGAGGHLKKLPSTPTIDGPRVERVDDAPRVLGAFGRVELDPAVAQAGRRVGVVVGAERDDQDVGVVCALVGDDLPRFRDRSP